MVGKLAGGLRSPANVPLHRAAVAASPRESDPKEQGRSCHWQSPLIIPRKSHRIWVIKSNLFSSALGRVSLAHREPCAEASHPATQPRVPTAKPLRPHLSSPERLPGTATQDGGGGGRGRRCGAGSLGALSKAPAPDPPELRPLPSPLMRFL